VTRAAETGWRPDSLPFDSALERRVRWSCWEMIEVELWRVGEVRWGEESPDVADRAIGRWAEVGVAPECSEELRSGEPT